MSFEELSKFYKEEQVSYKTVYKKVITANILQHYTNAKALHHLEMMKVFFDDKTPEYQRQATDELIKEYEDRLVDEILLVKE